MDYNLDKPEELPEILKQVVVGDSVIFPKSWFDTNSVNYNEYLINLKSSGLKCDCECDMAHAEYRLKCTFITKKSLTTYGEIFRINVNHEFLKPVKPITTITSSNSKYENRDNSLLSIKNGLIVRLNTGEEGKVVKYSSNKEISIQLNSGTIIIVNKEAIKEILG